MSRRINLLAVLLFAAALVLGGCGDDDDSGGGTPDAGADVGDVGGGDQTVEDTNGDACFVCASNDDCSTLGDYWCSSGCCMPSEPSETCNRHGDPCESAAATTPNFICDTGLNLCLARCLSDDLATCPTGAYCVEANDQTDDFDGACLPGDCTVTDGNHLCDDGSGPDTGTCQGWGNGASFCIPGGTVALGDECVWIAQDYNPAEMCEPGLFCFNSECVEPCPYDPADTSAGCDDPETCVPVFEHSGTNRPGVCGTECEMWSADECAEGERCEISFTPVNGFMSAAICVDYMTDDGGAVIDIVELGEECDADGSDGYDNQCGEGAYCIEYAIEDGTGRCERVCDSALESDAALASCEAEVGEVYFSAGDAIAFGEKTGYLETPAIDGQGVQFWEDGATVDDPVLRLGNRVVFDLANETATSILAYFDGVGYRAAAFLDWDAASVTAASSDEVTRIYNLTNSEIDVFAAMGNELAADLTPGTSNAADFAELSFSRPGTNVLGYYGEGGSEVDETAGSTFSVLPTDVTETNAKIDFILIGDVNPTDEIFPETLALVDDHPVLTTEAAIRVVNASFTAGAIDVHWGASDDTPDEAAVAYGATTAAWHTATADQVVTVDWGEAGTLTTTITGVAAHDVYTLVLWDGAAGDTPVFLQLDSTDAAAGDLSFRMTNASTVDATYFGFEVPMSRGIAAGASVPDGAGGIVMSPGTYDVVARRSADVEGPAADPYSEYVGMTDDAIVVPDGETASQLLSVVVSRSTDEEEIGFVEASLSAIPTLEAAHADLQVLHFAHGANGIELFTAGIQTVCVPLTIDGLGRCITECTPPHLMGVPLVDAEGNSTDAWEDNGCPQHEPVGVVWSCRAFEEDIDATGIAGEPDGPRISGFCIDMPEAFAVLDFGDTCTDDPDDLCQPDALCVGIENTPTGVRGECLGQCLPFSGAAPSGCPFDTTACYNTLEDQSYGFCLEVAAIDGLDIGEGDACLEADGGKMCDEDDTFCLGLSDGTTTDWRARRVCLSPAEANGEAAVTPHCPETDTSDGDRECVNLSYESIGLHDRLGFCDI